MSSLFLTKYNSIDYQKMLPKKKDNLENPLGYPLEEHLPEIKSIIGKYNNTLYTPNSITSDWSNYKLHLQQTKPNLKPRVLFLSHDISEIENITLMALGGIVRDMNGEQIGRAHV